MPARSAVNQAVRRYREARGFPLLSEKRSIRVRASSQLANTIVETTRTPAYSITATCSPNAE
jgi:hypothetical protein